MKSIVALGALIALTLYGPSTAHAALSSPAHSLGTGAQSSPTHLIRRADQASPPAPGASSKSAQALLYLTAEDKKLVTSWSDRYQKRTADFSTITKEIWDYAIGVGAIKKDWAGFKEIQDIIDVSVTSRDDTKLAMVRIIEIIDFPNYRKGRSKRGRDLFTEFFLSVLHGKRRD